MAIDPLGTSAAANQLLPANQLPPANQKKDGPARIPFDAVLGALRQAGDGSGAKSADLTAAELFRMEMMQSSLALSGEDPAPHPGGLPALEALLAQAGSSGGTSPARPFRLCPVPAPAWAPPAEAALAGPAVSTPANSEASAIEATAARYLGTPYRFGGEGTDGIDCSSFVQKVFREHQVYLPRTAREQLTAGSEVAPGDLRKGDLVFFQTYASYPSHVGIYLGDGKMIHASSGRGEVAVSDMNSEFYRARYLGARRVTALS